MIIKKVMIDYACQFNLFFCEYSYDCIFSRTCFKPYWDYIDAYDYMNLIEALGLHHLTKKPKPNVWYH